MLQLIVQLIAATDLLKICFLVCVAVLSLLFEIFVMGKICTVSKT